MTTLMQLVKLVLDDAYGEILPGPISPDDQIKAALQTLDGSYRELMNPQRVPIDYSNPATRFAYIYKYTVAHADYIRQVIVNVPSLRVLFQRQAATVSCLGGGPGSDFLGIMKYMLCCGSNTSLGAFIFDKERAWGDSWSEVARQLDAPFRYFPAWQQMDVTNCAEWNSYKKFLKSDLFTLCYFVSELWSLQEPASQFLVHCFQQAQPGAQILYIDNNDRNGRFVQWFERIVGGCNYDLIHGCAGDMVFEVNEEKTDLEPYYTRFGWVKRKGNVAVRVAIKR